MPKERKPKNKINSKLGAVKGSRNLETDDALSEVECVFEGSIPLRTLSPDDVINILQNALADDDEGRDSLRDAIEFDENGEPFVQQSNLGGGDGYSLIHEDFVEEEKADGFQIVKMRNSDGSIHPYRVKIPIGSQNSDESSEEDLNSQLAADSSHIEYTDPFADESLQTDDPFADTPVGRLKYYNYYVHTGIYAALHCAISLGLPRLDFAGFPEDIPNVSHEFLERAYEAINKIANSGNLEEQSADWVAISIYLNFVEACRYATLNRSHPKIFERMMSIGAGCRELELQHNREPAQRHRDRSRFGAAGGKARALSEADHQERDRHYLQHRSAGLTKTRSAERAIKELGLKSAKTGEPLKPNSFLDTRRNWKKKYQSKK